MKAETATAAPSFTLVAVAANADVAADAAVAATIAKVYDWYDFANRIITSRLELG